MDKLEDLEQGGADASAEVKEQARPSPTYLTETCGNPMDNLEMPEMPEMPESTGLSPSPRSVPGAAPGE